MSRIADIKYNDTVDCDDGICVSLWVSGCPHRCLGCHNSSVWDFNSGSEIPSDIKGRLVKAITTNGLERNFSVLGGEPLCPENIDFVEGTISAIRAAFPHIKIFVWTGYTLEQLQNIYHERAVLSSILEKIDVLIDGPYIESLRDITLPLRGSANQRILKKGIDF